MVAGRSALETGAAAMDWRHRIGRSLSILTGLMVLLEPFHVAFAKDRSTSLRAQVGTASWYGPRFHGRKTATGARFDQDKLTAAHRTLPLDTVVRVTNLENNHSVVVLVNDRGPYIKGRVLDLSKGAARALDMVEDGLARVRIEPLYLARKQMAVR
jgi:rare lipoprotein A